MLQDLLNAWKDSESAWETLREAQLIFKEPALTLDWLTNSVFISERTSLLEICKQSRSSEEMISKLSAPAPRGYVWALCFAEGEIALARVQIEELS